MAKKGKNNYEKLTSATGGRQNISFNEDINTLTEVQFKIILESGERKSTLCGVELESLIYFSYGLVKIEIPELLKEGKFLEIFQNILNEKGKSLSLQEIDEQEHNDLLACLIWIKDELESIGNLEKEYLSNPPEADLINAGIRELDELGEFNTIDTLAGGDILKHEQIKALPYHYVFDKLRKQTLENKISKNLAKIQQQKMKQKR